MEIFGIGLAGYIGSVVAEKLIAAGHRVRALVRSAEGAALVSSYGGTPVSGAMKDIELVKREALVADAVVQVSLGGFLTEAKGREAEATDAVYAILSSLEGSQKPYIFTCGAGAWMGRLANERLVLDDTLQKLEPMSFYEHWIVPYEAIMSAGNRGIRAMAIHPSAVFGREGGYINPLSRRFQTFRNHGALYVTYPGDGVLSLVHVDDLADLYLLALDRGHAGGSYFAVSDNVTMIELTRLVSQVCGQGGAVQAISRDKLRSIEGWTGILDFDLFLVAESEKARRELGWCPKRPSLATEMQRLIDISADVANIYPGPRRQAKLASLDLRPPPEYAERQ